MLHCDPAYFEDELQQLFGWLEINTEDAFTWQAAFSALQVGLPALFAAMPHAEPAFAGELIDCARLAIAELAQRQTPEALVRHMARSNRLGLMTSQLLAALDVSDSANILAQHLPQLGIPHALVALYAQRISSHAPRLYITWLRYCAPASCTATRWRGAGWPKKLTA